MHYISSLEAKYRSRITSFTIDDYCGFMPDMPGWNPEAISVFIVRTARGEELMSRIDLESVGLHKALMNHVGHIMYYARHVKRAVRKLIPGPIKRVIKKALRRK